MSKSRAESEREKEGIKEGQIKTKGRVQDTALAEQPEEEEEAEEEVAAWLFQRYCNQTTKG